MALFRAQRSMGVTIDPQRVPMANIAADDDMVVVAKVGISTSQPRAASSGTEPRASWWEMGVGAVFFVVALLLAEFVLDKTDVTFNAPQGIGAFALFYVMALGIERLLEFLGAPIERFLAWHRGTDPFAKKGSDEEKGSTGEKPRSKAVHRTKPALQATRDAKVVKAIMSQSSDTPENLQTSTAEEEAARAQADVDIATKGRSAALAGIAAGLGVLASDYMNADFLTAVGVAGAHDLVKLAITGLVVAGGSKQLHDFISNISKASEQKDTPAETARGKSS